MGVFHVNGRTYEYTGERPAMKVSPNGAVQFNGKTVKPRPPAPPQQQQGAKQ